MRIDVTVSPAQASEALHWLTTKAGAAIKRRGEYLAKRLGQNRYLDGFFDKRFGTEMTIYEALKRHSLTRRYVYDGRTLVPFGLVSTLRLVYENLNEPAQKRLMGRFIGALHDDVGLIPLVFELNTIVHLCSRGFDVDCVDLCESETKRYDFLARKGNLEVEIECKTISADAGHRIRVQDFLSLAGRLRPLLDEFRGRQQINLVSIQVPERLDNSDSSQIGLLDLCRRAVAEGAAEDEFGRAEYQQLPLLTMGDMAANAGHVQAILNNRPNFGTGQILFHVTAAGTLVALAVGSEKVDKAVDAVVRQAKQAADQCTGTRPTIVALQLVDMSSDTLIELVNSNSPLYDVVHQIFGDGRRDHVNFIAFMTQQFPSVRAQLPTIIHTHGTAGAIMNPHPTFVAEDLKGIFMDTTVTRPLNSIYQLLVFRSRTRT